MAKSFIVNRIEGTCDGCDEPCNKAAIRRMDETEDLDLEKEELADMMNQGHVFIQCTDPNFQFPATFNVYIGEKDQYLPTVAAENKEKRFTEILDEDD